MTWFERLGVTWLKHLGVTWLSPTAIAAVAIAVVASTLSISAPPTSSTGPDTLSFSSGAPDGMAFSGARTDGQGRSAIDQQIAQLHNRRITGEGIDVAIIDTGVSPVPGLDMEGKVLHGPDLSAEGSLDNLATFDTYGHGTHLAGIIAGDDGQGYVGVAPDARLVSLKIAGADGETNIAQAIAAIEWVIEHRNTDGLNIRVLNLSFGLDSVTSSMNDPLSAVVERAWDAGIVVVAAAGNRGNNANGIDSPALSPYVIAVAGGETSEQGVGTWSSGGDGYRNPDVVGAGRSIVSLRVPGSAIALEHPEAQVDERFSKGTGTSQAAAVVSGSVALMLSARPRLTPDEVKFLLTATALEADGNSTRVDGHGFIRPANAINRMFLIRWRRTTQTHARALGITNWDGIDSWSGGAWNGATWSGATWSGATWSGATWSGATWSGATWSGATWSGATWSSTSDESAAERSMLVDGIDWSQARWNGTGWDHSGTNGGPVREADIAPVDGSDDKWDADGTDFDYKKDTPAVPAPESDSVEFVPAVPAVDGDVVTDGDVVAIVPPAPVVEGDSMSFAPPAETDGDLMVPALESED